MPIDFSGPLLVTSHAGAYRPLGFGGEPVHGNYRKLVAVIESRLGPAAARYLARPEMHEASRSIGWHATVDGPVRRWSELTPTEQASLGPIFEILRAKLQGLVRDLEAAGPSATGASPSARGGAQENFGHALRLALRSPGMDNLFFVGDQPVLALWGFEGGAGPGFDSLGFRPDIARGLRATEVAVVPAGRPWWRWLLWLLGLLLLLLLLLLALHSCLRVPVPLVDKFLPQSLQPAPESPVAPNQATSNGTTILGPNGTTTVVPGGTVTGPGNGTVVPGENGTVAPGTNEGAVPGTTPDTAKGTQPDQGSQGQGNQPPGPNETPNEQNQADQNKNNQDQNNQDQTGQNKDNQANQDQSKQNQDQQNQNGQNSQNQPPKPEQPQNQQPQNQPGNNPPTEGLKLPPPGGTGQNLGFLQGEWTSKSGLFDRATGKPLRQTYSFDEQGKGTVTIYRSDSTQCKGQAQAQLTGKGGLTIQDAGPITCPDGTSYAPSVTKCEQGKGGDATCTGVNKSGSTYHVEIVR
jgi:hypothetical protein